ncbi:Cytochrome c, class I [Azoarcus sp. CIB]|uniref:c-type cytochrome n=1 Tax=Aromatoleum sp. (strain CIB) TaxID=198107 RepID=UPI0006A2F5C2|nr:cytochrome C [Azoarcus sp. CIB]AKU13170.1 Cytochrome c, class I [Azoarcus sp. CIB]
MTGKSTLAALCLLAGTTHAADSAALHARNLAANCTPCHSADAPAPNAIPRIVGLPADRLLHRLRAFRSGDTPATVMHQIVRGYSDEQLSLIAAHLAGSPDPALDPR